MGRKLQTEQFGVFPGPPLQDHFERDKIIGRALAVRAGLPEPENQPYENLGRKDLPFFDVKEKIKKSIRDNLITAVEGPTGSGKSTQIGQYALEMGYKKIVYLEPHINQADNLSNRLVVELSAQLGGDKGDSMVGVRHSEKSTGRGKQIEVMTPGTFLRVMSELDPYADEPVLIIGDEIHTKDFETEMAVAASARLLQDHSKWRMALLSATMDYDAVNKVYSSINGRSLPKVSAKTRPHELKVIEESNLTPAEVYAKYGHDHQKTLIFTAGVSEIIDTKNDLRAMQLGRVAITPMHSKLTTADRERAVNYPLEDNERQVIPSTNINESGVTIEGLTLVISDGTVKRKELDEDGVPGLFKNLSAQDELKQEAGRAGRDTPGGMFVLCRPDDPDFDFVPLSKREEQAPAQIYQTNLAGSVLLAESFEMNFNKINEYLIHGVRGSNILDAYEILYRLQAVDENNNITELGKEMSNLPLRPELARVVIEAKNNHVSHEVMEQLIGMVSAVEAGGLPLFQKDIGTKWRDDIRQETKDDLVAQLNMFYATRRFYNHGYIDEAALQSRNYDIRNVRQAHKTFDKIMTKLGYDPTTLIGRSPSPDQLREIQKYLITGLFDYVYQSRGTKREKAYLWVHDTSDGETLHELSTRGTYRGGSKFITGFPRRFQKKDHGTSVIHTTVEHVLPTDLDLVAKAARHAASRESVANSTVDPDGVLIRKDRLYLGNLLLEEVPSRAELVHTEETKNQLFEAAFAKPFHALKELISIKKKLEKLARLVPDPELTNYFPDGIITDQWIRNLARDSIDNTVNSVGALDNKLRTFMVFNKISARSWVSEENESKILKRSPESIKINRNSYNVYYSHGKPIINNFNLLDANSLPDHIMLADGREVLITGNADGLTKRLTAQQIKSLII